MGIFNATSWTGRSDVTAVLDRPRPVVRSKRLEAEPVDAARADLLKTYTDIAKRRGLVVPELAVEEFKDYLRSKPWPVFGLEDVKQHMDKSSCTMCWMNAAAAAPDRSGWHWRPLRRQDVLVNRDFGIRRHNGTKLVFSDWYSSRDGNRPFDIRVYDQTIPAHAAIKLDIIEGEFDPSKKYPPVKFFVSDYTTDVRIADPDPFLMAVIDNPKLALGIGRFVIDYWDEPGFGELPKGLWPKGL